MKKIWMLSILITIILFNIGCGSGASKNRSFDLLSDDNESLMGLGSYTQGEFGEIDVNSTYKVPKKAIFLDIRNDWERMDWQEEWSDEKKEDIWTNSNLALGSIGGAVYEYRDQEDENNRSIREEFLDEVLKISSDNRAQRLLLICNSSSRTQKAAKFLSDNNFTFVEHVVGGMSAWGDANLTTATFDTIEVDGDYNVSKNSLFLDIRNSWEREDGNYARGSIDGAVYEYRDQQGEKDREVRAEFVSEVLSFCENNRTKPIMLICNTSSRTAKAAKLLVENGFYNIRHIKGGLVSWKGSGLLVGDELP